MHHSALLGKNKCGDQTKKQAEFGYDPCTLGSRNNFSPYNIWAIFAQQDKPLAEMDVLN